MIEKVLINILKDAILFVGEAPMGGEFEIRGLIATFSTLKWFIVIGIIITIIGVLFIQFEVTMIGVILLWVGATISLLSIIALFFFWLVDRVLEPK